MFAYTMKITYMNPINSHPHFCQLKTSKSLIFQISKFKFCSNKKKGDIKPTDIAIFRIPQLPKVIKWTATRKKNHVFQVHLFFTQVYVNKSSCTGGGGELESQWIWQQLAREQRFDLKSSTQRKDSGNQASKACHV
jgi:hypothetical protein